MNFPCNSCGMCCRNIGEVQQLADFNDGKGVCIHLNNNNQCDIYEERPIWCNVEKLYEHSYSDLLSEEDWIKANVSVCNTLSTNQLLILKRRG